LKILAPPNGCQRRGWRAWAASRAFSRADISGNSAVIWKVRDMPSRQIWWLGRPVIGWSANRISPAVGLTVPVITLNSVVLPAPLGPMMARTSPSSTLRAT
jgi:hypothetical protein